MTFVLHGYVINPSADADVADLDPMRAKMPVRQYDSAMPSSLVGSYGPEHRSDGDGGARSHNNEDVPSR